MRRLKQSMLKEKKGDIESLIYVIIALFVGGVMIFFFSHFNNELYTSIEAEINETYNHTEGFATLKELETSNSNIWDYAFILLFVGHVMALGFTAWFVRVSPIFYWIYFLMAIFVLIAGVTVSNTWQDIVADQEFTTTLARFPMTNYILGEHFMIIETAIIAFTLIILFAKPAGGQV